MVKIEEHMNLIKETKERIKKTKNYKTKMQLTKYLHKLQKDLKITNYFLNKEVI